MFKKELWEWFLVCGANLEANRYMFLFLPTHLSFCFIWCGHVSLIQRKVNRSD